METVRLIFALISFYESGFLNALLCLYLVYFREFIHSNVVFNFDLPLPFTDPQEKIIVHHKFVALSLLSWSNFFNFGFSSSASVLHPAYWKSGIWIWTAVSWWREWLTGMNYELSERFLACFGSIMLKVWENAFSMIRHDGDINTKFPMWNLRILPFWLANSAYCLSMIGCLWWSFLSLDPEWGDSSIPWTYYTKSTFWCCCCCRWQ